MERPFDMRSSSSNHGVDWRKVVTEKRMPRRIAKAEAHAFCAEMIRQGVEGGDLWCYNDSSQEIIENEIRELCGRHERYAGYATIDKVNKYRRTDD